MDVRALECFLAVAAEGSISRAAVVLRMTQPPLSVRLQALERELGVSLLIRHGRGVELTAAGRLLAERGRRIQSELATTVEQVRAVGTGTRGVLSIALSHTVSARLLSHLARNVVSGDAVDLRLLAGDDHEVIERVARREAQAGFIHLAPTSAGRPIGSARGLEVAVVAREPLVVVLPADHPAADLERVDLGALTDARIVLSQVAARGLSAHTRLVWAAADGAERPFRHEATSVAQALSLVEAGAGAALLPAQVTSLLWGGLVARPVLQHSSAVETAVLWRVDDDSPVLRRFLRAALATPEPDMLDPRLLAGPSAGAS
ncbi:LysR family transcriptional regulator [Pseudonocardia alni]|uniref:LysR family transcriptional regulator n=1 Tax=Pseudonocardia alni TaxID=33907 RepID=UPI00280BC9C7|nr:LysR substrate-binding domain-containing protein [Pseudonocardia alni]